LDLNTAISYGYHRLALQRLEAGGADFALIASNTPHHRFASIVRGIGIPVVGIFDAAREVLILGSPLTTTSPKFREAFAKYGVRAAGPCGGTAAAMTAGLITELQLGKVKRAAERLARIVRVSLERQCKAEPAVCLACKELPLGFGDRKTLATLEYDGVEYDGVLYINGAAVHINAAFDFLVGDFIAGNPGC
jgi:aspartate racemase